MNKDFLSLKLRFFFFFLGFKVDLGLILTLQYSLGPIWAAGIHWGHWMHLSWCQLKPNFNFQ